MIELDKIQNIALRNIAEKVLSETPVSDNDARFMLSTNDVLDLGLIADHIKREHSGDKAFYGVNMNINYTNICDLRCPLCAFSKDMKDKDAFLLSLDTIEQKVKDAVVSGIDEVHIVGGLNPDLSIDYFVQLLKRIKKIKEEIFIVAFTAVEYDYFSRINNIPLEEIFRLLIDAGLGAIPGGGAEIFAEDPRKIIAPKKISGERWLEVMRTAHRMGLKSNATMLYNHIESIDDIVDHLSKIRDLQYETGGFKTFVPLLFHENNTKIRAREKVSTGFDDIRIYSASRIFLHNIPHIKALWMYIGDKMAQTLLNFGVDDIGATYNYEKVVHAAGASTPNYGKEDHLRRLIQGAGLIPIRTTADYKGA